MESNKHIKIGATAILLFNLAVSVLLLVSTWFDDNYWRVTDVVHAVNVSLAYYAFLATYSRGKTDWYITMVFFALGSLVVFFVYDCIHCAKVYLENKTYTDANAILNRSYELTNWLYILVLWGIFVFVFFCSFMPNLPSILHKK